MNTSRRSFFGLALGGFAAALGLGVASPTQAIAALGRQDPAGWTAGVTNLRKGGIITLSGEWTINPGWCTARKTRGAGHCLKRVPTGAKLCFWHGGGS